MSADTSAELSGLRVLVLEDEAMISMLIEDMLTDLGCEVVGPAFRVGEALELAGSAPLDAAVLDVNVAGDKSFGVADRLAERGVPFAFATGYGEAGLRPQDIGRPVLEKPFRMEDLRSFLASSRGQAAPA